MEREVFDAVHVSRHVLPSCTIDARNARCKFYSAAGIGVYMIVYTGPASSLSVALTAGAI